MNQDDAGRANEGIEGLPVDAAVDRVTARNDSHDPDAVRAILENVAEDGVVTWEGVEAALGHASNVVSTPETRVELAEMELAEAREAAKRVEDLDIVAARLEEFESQLSDVRRQSEELSSKLDSLVDRAAAEGNLFAVAADVRRIESAANQIQGIADDLKLDVEEFQRWISIPSVRYRELEGDVDALEESIGELEAAVERTTSALDESADSDPSDGALETDDVGALWFELILQQKTLAFMSSDIRAELAELRTWAERKGESGGDRLDDTAARLDETESRVAAVSGRLDTLTRRAWIERFAGEISSLDRSLDDLDQPADWVEVEQVLKRHREAVE